MICQVSERTIIRQEALARARDLLGGECANCGSTEQLQFDHIKRDRKDNYHQISAFIDAKWERVLKELKKCQLLCRKCHMRKSNAERGRTGIYNHGTANRYRILHCRCELCSGCHKAYMKEWHRKRKLQMA